MMAFPLGGSAGSRRLGPGSSCCCHQGGMAPFAARGMSTRGLVRQVLLSRRHPRVIFMHPSVRLLLSKVDSWTIRALSTAVVGQRPAGVALKPTGPVWNKTSNVLCTRPTGYVLTGLPGLWQAVNERVSPERDGEKGCCGLQGSCFEKGMAPNAVTRCRPVCSVATAKQHAGRSRVCQHPPGHPCRAAKEERGVEGWVPWFVSVWPAIIITAPQHEQQAGTIGSDGARARVVGRIPDSSTAPSSPRHGSEIQGIEKRRGHWHDRAWMGWDDDPSLHRTPHTSLPFPGRLARNWAP
jgi:hypothetical protein